MAKKPSTFKNLAGPHTELPPNVPPNLPQKVIEWTDLYPWQVKCFNELRDERLAQINAPTGSGKSRVIVYLAGYWILEKKKVVLSVPANDIATNFCNPEPGYDVQLAYSGGKKVSWVAAAYNDKRVKALRDFLTGKVPGAVVVTHQCLALLQEEIKANPSLLDDVALIIDEAHHVRHDNEVKLPENYSRLGAVVRQAVGNEQTRVLFATATPFRGDRLPILDRETEKGFRVFVRSMQDHLADSGIDAVRTHLVTYRGELTDYPKAVERIYKEILPNKKTVGIVYMPHTTARLNKNPWKDSRGNKRVQLRRLHKAVVAIGRKPFDLVDFDTQEENKKQLAEARIANKPLPIDTYLSMNLFQEGSDDSRIQHVVSIGYQGSLVRIIQRIGRATRRYPGKNVVDFFLVMPRGHDPLDAAEFNRFMKTLCLTFAGIDVFEQRDTARPKGLTHAEHNMPPSVETRAPDEIVEDREAAVKAFALFYESPECKKDKDGQPLNIAAAYAAGVQAAIESAKARGADEKEQAAAGRDAHSMMPRLLDHLTVWFADDLDVQLVEMKERGYTASQIDGAVLKKINLLVQKQQTVTKLKIADKIREFVKKYKRVPVNSKTNAYEKEVHKEYKKLIDPKHLWFLEGFKEEMKKLALKSAYPFLKD